MSRSWAEKATLLSLLGAITVVSLYLAAFWREQPELSHAIFAPLCAFVLFYHSRDLPDLSLAWGSTVRTVLHGFLVVAGIVVGWTAAISALAQGPFHALTGFLAGMGLCFFIGSAVFQLASPTGAVRLNAASASAALLWLLAVPLPGSILTGFSLLLQERITAASVHTLHALGMAAVRHGNVIELPHVVIGVEEACSGVRSLIACLFAGLVLQGLMLRGSLQRVTLLLGAGILALVANFGRSLVLCLMAARGIEIRGFWHDFTTYGVLGITTLVLFVACLVLSRRVAHSAEATQAGPRSLTLGAAIPFHAILTVVFAGLMILVALKTMRRPTEEQTPPDLQALLNIDQAGWKRRSDDSIFSYSQALNTSYLRQETYLRNGTQITLYVAFWPSRRSTLGSVAIHSPSICLPGDGWTPQASPPPIDHYPLPIPRRFTFTREAYPQYIWFWHFFDGKVVGATPSLVPWRLGSLLFHRGVSADAPQWVVRISSNKPLETLLNEPLVVEFFARLRATGLAGQSG